MPNLNRTGPQGRGAMTGRQMGRCNDNINMENFAYGKVGRGNGRGRGFGNRNGLGFGRNRQEFLTNVSEKTLIENEINTLKDQLSSLEKQLGNLNKDD